MDDGAWLDASMLALMGVLLVYGVYHLLLGLGGWRLPRRSRSSVATWVRGPGAEAPLVTFVVTAYRERTVLFACLDSILTQRYPPERCRVVLVADEDDEGTLDAIRARLQGEGARCSRNAEGDEVIHAPRVTAILQTGARAARGKPRALQNAMRYVPREGLVGVLDADHVLDPHFVGRCLARFDDPRVGIVQARRVPKERPVSWISRWDVLEQNVGHVQALLAKDRIGCASFYGSTALIRADILHAIGWQNCLAEDTLLNYEIRERGYRVAYEAGTGSREDHVRDLRAFVVQRRRWAAGHMQVLFGKLSTLRGRQGRRRERWESFLTLNYYNATLVVLAYWLVRATHHWLQQPPLPMQAVALASLLVGVMVWRFERSGGGDWTARMRGAVVAIAIAYGAISLIVSLVWPAPSPPPVPAWLEVGLFFTPLAQIAFGYANPRARPRVFKGLDHARNLLVLVVFAPVMLLVNAYATLTGVLVSIEGPGVKWVKTVRDPARRRSLWNRIT